MLAPFARAPLADVCEGAAELVEEPEAEPVLDGEVALPEGAVADADDAVRVTPTAAHSCCAADSAAARSLPWQVDSMHDVVLLMNAWLLHRQVSSVPQLPVSALARQVCAHVGSDWRRKTETCEADTAVRAERATKASVKRMVAIT